MAVDTYPPYPRSQGIGIPEFLDVECVLGGGRIFNRRLYDRPSLWEVTSGGPVVSMNSGKVFGVLQGGVFDLTGNGAENAFGWIADAALVHRLSGCPA